MTRSDPRYARKLEDLEARLLDQQGALDTAIRRAVAGEGEPPESAVSYVDKVRRHAYRVTDDDVRALRAAGYSEDQIFELTIVAAYGAARRGLAAGLEAMAPRAMAGPGTPAGSQE